MQVDNDDNDNYYAYDDAFSDGGQANGSDDGGNNDDDNGVNEDDVYQADDFYAARKLSAGQRQTAPPTGARQSPSSFSDCLLGGATIGGRSSLAAQKHSFNGIRKLRDHQEHVIEPAVRAASRTYCKIMAQFDDESDFTEFQRRELEDTWEGEDRSAYQAGAQARTVLVVLFLFLLGVIGRRRRMRTRFAILRSRAQDDHLLYAAVLTKNGASGSLATPDNTVMENFHEREDKFDGACSHTLFGCYPVDKQLPHYTNHGTDDDQTAWTAESATTKKRRRGADFLSRAMSVVFSCCCGCLCNCWCQWFSICALAQEARETRLLLPPSMQRIDIVTHQPFHEYAKDVNNVRRRFMEDASGTWVQHWAAMSHLGRYILLGFSLIAAFVVTVMVVHPMGGFDWGDALMLIATFTQSFLVLVIVFGIFHRSDLSFDAVVKFFAAGFLVCVPVGFVMEGIVMNGLFMLVYVVYYVLFWIGGNDFDDWYQDNYQVLSMLGELVNAYFVAR